MWQGVIVVVSLGHFFAQMSRHERIHVLPHTVFVNPVSRITAPGLSMSLLSGPARLIVLDLFDVVVSVVCLFGHFVCR
jgi:hypothetical protein